MGPLVEGLQRGRIILVESGLELVDQRGALLDQLHFVPTEQAQFFHQRIGRRQRPPSLAIDPQRISKTPGIGLIGLGAAGHVTVAVALRGLGLHRIDRHAAGQQLFDCRPVTGLNGHGQSRPGFDLFSPLRPALRRVRESEGGHSGSGAVQYDRVMMILRPVETGEVRELFERVHGGCLSTHRRPTARRADIRTLAG